MNSVVLSVFFSSVLLAFWADQRFAERRPGLGYRLLAFCLGGFVLGRLSGAILHLAVSVGGRSCAAVVGSLILAVLFLGAFWLFRALAGLLGGGGGGLGVSIRA